MSIIEELEEARTIANKIEKKGYEYKEDEQGNPYFIKGGIKLSIGAYEKDAYYYSTTKDWNIFMKNLEQIMRDLK